jgi:hypothetical protein
MGGTLYAFNHDMLQRRSENPSVPFVQHGDHEGGSDSAIDDGSGGGEDAKGDEVNIPQLIVVIGLTTFFCISTILTAKCCFHRCTLDKRILRKRGLHLGSGSGEDLDVRTDAHRNVGMEMDALLPRPRPVHLAPEYVELDYVPAYPGPPTPCPAYNLPGCFPPEDECHRPRDAESLCHGDPRA